MEHFIRKFDSDEKQPICKLENLNQNENNQTKPKFNK